MGQIGRSGERMAPGRADPGPEIQHWQRYRYVRPLLKGRRVLDAGCGEGYGANFLAPAAREVVGLDLSAEAIAHAASNYRKPGLSFRQGDAQALAGLGSFDAIVAYGLLEQLQDPRRFLAECRASLPPDGVLILSASNRILASGVSAAPLDPFRVREWTLPEFRSLVGEHFPSVEFFHQPIASPWDVFPGVDEGALVFIAVCGARPVTPLLDPFVRPTGIILLCYDNVELSDLCMRYVARFTPDPIDVVIVDNGSTDGTGEWAAKLQKSFTNVRVITNRENRGFAPAVNQGLAALEEQDALLLSNDVLVTPGWLGRVKAALREDPTRGIVGPLSNYAADPQRIDLPSYGDDLRKMLWLSSELAIQWYSRGFEARRLSGFCFLIAREVIGKIGGLDERFVPGFFEDDDYVLRARLAGFRPWVAADVFVHHFGNRTLGKAIGGSAPFLSENWKRFKEKWGLPADLEAGPFYACDKVAPRAFDPGRDVVLLPKI